MSYSMLWSLYNMLFFVHISSITQKLWPPEVYQACSTQIKSGRTGCQCDICGVTFVACQGVNMAMYKNISLLYHSYPHNQVPGPTF